LSAPLIRRLHPDAAELTAEEAMGSLELGRRAPADRPYVIANMAVTADGKATIEGRSGPIGGEADHDLFHALRRQVDAVLVGTGTLRAERYGRLVRDPSARAARERRGLAADPLAVTVTRSGRLPFDIPLFEDPHSTIVVFTATELEPAAASASVRVERLADPSLTAVLAALRAGHGVHSVLCEGGPTLLSGLVSEGVLDELFLTLAPRLAGGGGARTALAGAPLAGPVELDLRWVLEHDGELLLRYGVRPSDD
jgi:riboflavin-specific deaminase-like protein